MWKLALSLHRRSIDILSSFVGRIECIPDRMMLLSLLTLLPSHDLRGGSCLWPCTLMNATISMWMRWKRCNPDRGDQGKTSYQLSHATLCTSATNLQRRSIVGSDSILDLWGEEVGDEVALQKSTDRGADMQTGQLEGAEDDQTLPSFA